MRNIKKSPTFTQSEKMLADIGDKVFLSLWSFANVYTDEGIKFSDEGRKKGQGEELCDLLVVFGNHVIIFSDKGEVEYKPNDDVSISWGRWVKRAYLKSAYSTHKAEKWLKENPNRIFLNKECSEKFPIELPKPEEMKVHRIAVARGITEHAKKYYSDTNGTLIIRPDVIGLEHLKIPFVIGCADKEKGYVHFLDELSIDRVFNELDTLRDFTDYLTKKEELIESGKLLAAPGEDDLLGYYLSSREGFKNLDSPYFLIPSVEMGDKLTVYPGFYEGHIKTREYRQIQEIKRISYFWDTCIETMGSAAFTGKWHHTNGTNYDEEITVLKYMASESRLARTVLSNGYSEIMIKPFSPDELLPRVRILGSPTNREICYVFLIMQKSDAMDNYEHYRELRKNAIVNYCMACKDLLPQFKTIVGIASDSLNNGGASEELIYIHTDDWTAEEFEEARRLRHDVGLLRNVKIHTNTDTKPEEGELAKSRKAKKKKNKAQKSARRKSR